MPARLNGSKYKEFLKIAMKAHKAFKCKVLQGQILNFIKINFYSLNSILNRE